jgi:hypothetical protein
MSHAVSKSTAPASPRDTTTPTPPEGPTVTHYQQAAADVNKALDAMLALMPNLVAVHPSTKGAVRTQKTVPDAFLVSVIAAVEEVPEMQLLKQLDVSEVRDSLQFNEAFRPLEDKLHAAGTNVGFSMDQKRAHAVTPSLQAYLLLKGLARNPAGTLAATHVSNLKRDLKRSGGKKKKKPVPVPAPVSPVPAAITAPIAQP